MRFFGISFILFLILSEGTSQSTVSNSRTAYIEQYKDLAIKEMKRAGIPASITLAQGILESGNGNSTLARKANNHFGIKCHNWKGQKIYHDDDKRGECFRKYKNVYESYKDHSEFLISSPRYAFLFELKPTDYKGWAKGLKKAGYATAKHYDKALIKIIEENNLHDYDLKQGKIKPVITPSESDITESYSVSNGHEVKTTNRIKYIVAKKGDTYRSLTNEFEMMGWQLAKYNDMPRYADINEGQVVYLQPKRNKAGHEHKYHTVKGGDTMLRISQLYGVKLNVLYKRNLMDIGSEPEVGEKIFLRGHRPSPPASVKNNMEFEFQLD